MLLVPTHLAQSAIHGTGVFATAPIAKGALMWEFIDGLDIVIPLDKVSEYPQAVQEYLDMYGYEDREMPGNLVLSGDDARYINHSHAPNTVSEGTKAYALRDIAAGEEITCNYLELNPAYAELPYVGHAVQEA